MRTFRFPDGITTRALTSDDARTVFELAAAQEEYDLGKVVIELADIVAGWQRPSWDITANTLGVFDGEVMVGYAELIGADRCDAAVHPGYRRRGIGTELARWLQHRARALGSNVIGSPVPQGSPGDQLLESLGYRVRWTSWDLVLPEGRTIADRRLPDGYDLRQATAEEYPLVHQVVEDAFAEWTTRDRETYQDFLAKTVRRPGFQPWNIRVISSDGEIVGAALLIMAGDPPVDAYVDRLAVRQDRRHQGLAQALLVDAFAQGREHGASRATLSTDSRTGALGLYQKVGMVIDDVWNNRAIDL